MGVDPVSFLWILLVLVLVLQPVLARNLTERARRAIIEKLQRKRSTSVIVLIHRQETISFFGIPVYRFLNMEDSEEVLRALNSLPSNKPVDIILHTPGGLVLAATQIARALKMREGKTTAFIPHYAMSGGTLIALAADEIYMAPDAVLGPVDPQLGGVPAPSIVKLRKMKDPQYMDDQTLVMIDVAEKAIEQMREFVFWLLKDKFPYKKAREIADLLTRGAWTHDFPLTVDALRELGFEINTDMPPEVFELMSLYKQPFRRQHVPSVEFFPEYNLVFRKR